MAKKDFFLKLNRRIENGVENFLWGFRFIIVLGVLGLLISAIVIFLVGAIETVSLSKLFWNQIFYHNFSFTSDIYNKIIIHIVQTVDDFLLGMVLLIFGLGTYDLFISKIDVVDEDVKKKIIRRPNWLRIGSLDELKSILGKIVLMILIINFLRFVVDIKFDAPLHLLSLAGGIALIALALKWSYGKDIEQTRYDELRKKPSKPKQK